MRFGRVTSPFDEAALQKADASQLVDLMAPAQGPQTSARMIPTLSQQQAQQSTRPALWEVLDGVLGLGIGDAIDAAQKRHDAPAQLAKLQQTLSLLPPDAQRDVILAISPKSWADEAAKQYAPQVVPAGSAQVVNNRVNFVPWVGMSGDSALSLTPNGATLLGQRPPSFAEQASANQKTVAQQIAELMAPPKIALMKAQAARAMRPPVGRGGGGAAVGSDFGGRYTRIK